MSSRVLDIALDLARKLKDSAGQFSGEYTDDVSRYALTGDATYEVDVPVEAAVQEYFSELDLPCRVMTEDSGVKDYGRDPEYIFLIDPLDGSRNARRLLPYYCCSIAVYDIDAGELSQAKCAVVERFDADEEFIAHPGGATLNGGKITSSVKEDLQDAMLSLGCHFAGSLSIYSEFADKLGSQVERDERNIWLKSYGSTALELAYLAAGRIDLLLDIRASTRFKATPKTYDIAAGLLLCQQAGAHVIYGSDRMPQKLAVDPNIPIQILAAGNEKLFNKLLNTLR